VVDPVVTILELWWSGGSLSVQVDTVGHVVSRYSMSATLGPQGIISLVIPQNGENTVNTLSQYMVEPRHVYWITTKHVLRYLHGMVGYGLRDVSDGAVKLQGYTNSDWEKSAVDGKSTSRCFFSLESGMISWLSRKTNVNGT
jgi:hypothetical protein